MVAFCQLAIGTELAESTSSLTLDAALAYAMRANPAIMVAERERQAIEGAKTQAAARPNPSISTSIQDTRSDNRQIYLQLNQEIELGNKREARIEAADSLYQKSNAELDSKKAEIHANVVSAFYELLAAQARLTLSQSSLDVANLALDACKGEWAFHIQADEVLHELDYPRLERAMQANLNRRSIEGLSFRYHHFRADYGIRDPLPYRRQVRIVRSGVGVQSCGDACGFEINGRKLRSVPTGAWVYHYGYVKPPSRMAAKMDYFMSLYDGRKVVPGEELKAEDYEWDLRTCEPFRGSHPKIMEARIAAMDWQAPCVQLIPRWRNHRFWSGLAHKNSRTIRRWAGVAQRFILPRGRQLRKAS